MFSLRSGSQKKKKTFFGACCVFQEDSLRNSLKVHQLKCFGAVFLVIITNSSGLYETDVYCSKCLV